MKNVAKALVLVMALSSVAVLGGCAKKCHKEADHAHHKYEKMKKEYGGK